MRFRNYEGGNVEIPLSTEMQVSAVSKVHQTRNIEKEAAVLKEKAILERLVL